MKTPWLGPRRSRPGFTLVELLVVISIIAILAAVLLPVLANVKTKTRVQSARADIVQIVAGIHEYDSANSRFPVSRTAMDAAAKPPKGPPEDFTYGTAGLICAGQTTIGSGFKTPSSSQKVMATTDDGTELNNAAQANNAEVMAILLDLEYYGDGRPTINKGHVKNTQRTRFLNAKFSGDTKSAGVGTDGVYRDPWGNPYIISIDLNNDEKTRDSFYRQQGISRQSGTAGYFGTVNTTDASGAGNNFEHNGTVMVWSAGPDKMIEPGANAMTGANRDNVLSWKGQ